MGRRVSYRSLRRKSKWSPEELEKRKVIIYKAAMRVFPTKDSFGPYQNRKSGRPDEQKKAELLEQMGSVASEFEALGKNGFYKHDPSNATYHVGLTKYLTSIAHDELAEVYRHRGPWWHDDGRRVNGRISASKASTTQNDFPGNTSSASSQADSDESSIRQVSPGDEGSATQPIKSSFSPTGSRFDPFLISPEKQRSTPDPKSYGNTPVTKSLKAAIADVKTEVNTDINWKQMIVHITSPATKRDENLAMRCIIPDNIANPSWEMLDHGAFLTEVQSVVDGMIDADDTSLNPSYSLIYHDGDHKLNILNKHHYSVMLLNIQSTHRAGEYMIETILELATRDSAVQDPSTSRPGASRRSTNIGPTDSNFTNGTIKAESNDGHQSRNDAPSSTTTPVFTAAQVARGGSSAMDRPHKSIETAQNAQSAATPQAPFNLAIRSSTEPRSTTMSPNPEPRAIPLANINNNVLSGRVKRSGTGSEQRSANRRQKSQIARAVLNNEVENLSDED